MSLTRTIEIKAQFLWTFPPEQPPGGLVAVCDALGLVLEADDEAELRSVIEEGLHHFFLTQLLEGTLDAFLRRLGWGSVPLEPYDPEQPVRFHVPWKFERAAHAP